MKQKFKFWRYNNCSIVQYNHRRTFENKLYYMLLYTQKEFGIDKTFFS